MSTRGIILYGPPASGKSTITDELTALDSRVRLFPRAKCGPGRVAGYRMISPDELDRLRSSGEVIWENTRYDATYVVDRDTLRSMGAGGYIPVVHLGQTAAVDAVVGDPAVAAWTVIHLWCPRDIAAQRVAARGTGDVAARLQAWDETNGLPTADVALDTSKLSPRRAAETALSHVLALQAGSGTSMHGGRP